MKTDGLGCATATKCREEHTQWQALSTDSNMIKQTNKYHMDTAMGTDFFRVKKSSARLPSEGK